MTVTEFAHHILIEIIDAQPQKTRDCLRAQLEQITSADMTLMKHGFDVRLTLAPCAPSLGEDVNRMLGDVVYRLNDMKHHTDYILHIKEGYLHSLEGFACGEDFPSEITSVRLIDTNTANTGKETHEETD